MEEIGGSFSTTVDDTPGLICTQKEKFMPIEYYANAVGWWPENYSEWVNDTTMNIWRKGTLTEINYKNPDFSKFPMTVVAKFGNSDENHGYNETSGTPYRIGDYTNDPIYVDYQTWMTGSGANESLKMSNRALSEGETYILSHISHGVSKQDVQSAYWNYQESIGKTFMTGDVVNTLEDEALAYEYFRNNVEWVKPKIDIDEATVSYNVGEQNYYIGPIKYIYTRFYIKPEWNSVIAAKENTDGRIDFAGIMNIDIKLDNGKKITLTPSHFVYKNGRTAAAKKDIADGYKYPQPYEECYIKLSYEECLDATKIEDFDIKIQKFDYSEGDGLIVTGDYYKFTGDGQCWTEWIDCPERHRQEEWCELTNKVNADGERICSCDEKRTSRHKIRDAIKCKNGGYDHSHKIEVTRDICEITCELVGQAQEVLYFGSACKARIFKAKFGGGVGEIALPNTGIVNLTKKVETNNGEEVPEDQVFTFRVTTHFVNAEGDEDTNVTTVRLADGQTYPIAMGWSEKELPPTYTIEEIDVPNGYSFKNFEVNRSTVSGNSVSGSFVSGTNIEIVCKNTDTPVSKKSGTLTINKEISNLDELTEDIINKEKIMEQVFKFNIYERDEEGRDTYLDTVEIKPNESVSREYEYYEGSSITLVVKEDESEMHSKFEFVKFQDNLNSRNEIVVEISDENNTVSVTAENKYREIPLVETGKLEIVKKLQGDKYPEGSEDKIFRFKITNEDGSSQEVNVSANNKYITTYSWEKGTKPPKIKVEEIDEEGDKWSLGLTSMKINGSPAEADVLGLYSLVKDETLTFTAENIYDDDDPPPPPTDQNTTNETNDTNTSNEINNNTTNEIPDSQSNEATLKIVKNVSGPDSSTSDSFSFKVIVNGIEETVSVSAQSPWSKTYTLQDGEEFEYSVIELSGDEKYKISGTDKASGTLKKGDVITVTFENRVNNPLILLTEIGGTVWEDEWSNGKPSILNGINDSTEKGIENVEVYIWKINGNSREPAKIYDADYHETSNPIYTDAQGKWSAQVPAPGPGSSVRYDVEFKYDGQTYETTTFLSEYDEASRSYVDGNSNSYMNASTEQRSAYSNRSMAKENESDREAFDRTFTEIYGNKPISAVDGTTIGGATGNASGAYRLDYTSEDYSLIGSFNQDNTRKKSTLVTKDQNGHILDQYKLSVKTSDSGLTFEFDDRYHIENYDKIIKINGQDNTYIATYNYMQNINLGLVKRKDADLGLTKDLYSANVVVNERLLTYNFNNAYKFMDSSGTETLNQQIKINEANIKYTLDLYKSDYFYRASMYETNQDKFNYEKISTVKNLETEMEVYLKYKISVYNESVNYKAQVNELIDYYDNRLTLVEATAENPDGETRVVKNYNGDEFTTGERKVVGEISTYDILNSGDIRKQGDTAWVQRGEISDGEVTYKEMYTNSLKGEVLDPGEQIDIYVTFRVNRDYVYKANAQNEVENSIQLGEMYNISEIANYSTFYENGKIAGKVDRDSAPDNINIREKNDKTWYEDDTDIAPSITISLYDEQRTIDGMVWEDLESEIVEKGYGQIIANGVIDEGEQGINGVTIQLVEKIVADDGLEYEYIWPEKYNYNGTTVNLLELSGLSSITLSGQYNIIENADGTYSKRPYTNADKYNLAQGNYKFIGVPAGNFVIRFIYGDTEDAINSGINGQDYKSTIYQAGISENIDTSGYLINEWHNLLSDEVAGVDQDGNVVRRISDARDLELRRMQVVAYSKTMINKNGAVLETADEHETRDLGNGKTNHTDLIENTKMIAETAKINVDVEKVDYSEVIPGVEINQTYGTTILNGTQTEISRHEYRIGNIDFGLEERSSTVLKLKKEISKITLTSIDGQVLIEANYAKDESGNMVASGTGVEHIQSLNSIRDDENNYNKIVTQGFRYINIDEKLMQGATIKIDYSIVVENLGEIDRVGALRNYNTGDEINAEVNRLLDRYNSSLNKSYGLYLGTIYYTGQEYNDNSDAVVTTKIEKVLDYVDNNAVFNAEVNDFIENNAWTTITTKELREQDLLEPTEMTEDEYNQWLSLSEEQKALNAKTYIHTSDQNNDGEDEYYIVDSDGVRYETDQKNNLVVNVNDVSVNPDLVINLVPEGAVDENGNYVSPDTETYGYKASIGLTTTKYISPENDTGDITFENIAEIIQFTNTVGRRDTEAVVGNAKPSLGETIASNAERDTDSTEIITLTPPTGLSMIQRMTQDVTKTSFVTLVITLVGVCSLLVIINLKSKINKSKEKKR